MRNLKMFNKIKAVQLRAIALRGELVSFCGVRDIAIWAVDNPTFDEDRKYVGHTVTFEDGKAMFHWGHYDLTADEALDYFKSKIS